MPSRRALVLTPMRILGVVLMLPIVLLSLVILFFVGLMFLGACVAVFRAVWP